MSRLEEVEAEIISADGSYHDGAWIGPESLRHLASTLAAEVDARDEVIAEILALLKPKGEAMKYMLGDQKIYHEPAAHLYARACEIAGRAE